MLLVPMTDDLRGGYGAVLRLIQVILLPRYVCEETFENLESVPRVGV